MTASGCIGGKRIRIPFSHSPQPAPLPMGARLGGSGGVYITARNARGARESLETSQPLWDGRRETDGREATIRSRAGTTRGSATGLLSRSNQRCTNTPTASPATGRSTGNTMRSSGGTTAGTVLSFTGHMGAQD